MANRHPQRTITTANMTTEKTADICLFLEGSYPYVPGGVATWTHELISHFSDRTFHLVTIIPPDAKTIPYCTLPKNIIGIDHIFLQKLPQKTNTLSKKEATQLFAQLELSLLNIQTHHQAHLSDLKTIITQLAPYREKLNDFLLLNSPYAWNMLIRMYNATLGNTGFLDYFWSWRVLLGGFYSILLAPIPKAHIYHALCTGYAGLLLARTHLETGKPCLVTEHGIYTNEREIEIASADWLESFKSFDLTARKNIFDRELRDFWIDTFYNYSKLCYEASSFIITLYEDNQKFQRKGGAEENKLMIIPNGVDTTQYSTLKKQQHDRPTVALIGRVVPIKDIKTFIHACQLVKQTLPTIHGIIAGPTDENPDYFQECQTIISHHDLTRTITFTGKVALKDLLPTVDICILTSISEAQPLVILEAGSAGIPFIATDIGACREMILGKANENPHLGPGGIIIPLTNPQAAAGAILDLFTNTDFYQSCCNNIQKRIQISYDKKDLYTAYDHLYQQLHTVKTWQE